MHSVFFGGIAQYYDSLGTMVQDNNCPFVKTIARVSRDASGTMAEYKLPIEMPSFLGAGSEFIPNNTLPHYANEVFKLDDFTADSTFVGYIFGGISSSAPNIFTTNTGTQSVASNQLFKVFVIKKSSVGMHDLNEQSTGTLKMQIYPNPSNSNIVILNFNLIKTEITKIVVHNVDGKIIDELNLTNTIKGSNRISYELKNAHENGTYFFTIETPSEKSTQKIIIEK